MLVSVMVLRAQYLLTSPLWQAITGISASAYTRVALSSYARPDEICNGQAFRVMISRRSKGADHVLNSRAAAG